MSNIIELKNVNKWFDKFQVLKEINLEVKPKEKIVVCGPSGSGKSTLIRCINRLEEHQEGSIIVDGLKGEVTARCGDLVANDVTLNFVLDSIDGKIKPSKETYAKGILATR